MGNSESSQIQASILVFDSDKVQRDKIESILKIMLPKALVVQAQDEQNILARGKSKNWDVIVLSQKNNKMSGDFVIRKILEVKEIPPPKYFCLLLNSEDVPPQLPASVVTLKTPAGDEDLKVFFSKVISDLEKIIPSQKAPIFKPDVSFINPFIEATLKVLETTCNTKASKEEVFLRRGDQTSGDISALIGMVSPLLKGSISIAFQRSCFLYVASEMLGEAQKEITSENQDAVGEICNQVFGLAKTVLNEKGYQLQPAIPSVIVGVNHSVKHMVTGPVIAVRFRTEGGTFTVEAALST